MSQPNLQLRRAVQPMRGTGWRPLSHVTWHGQRLDSEQLQSFLNYGSLDPKPIGVEHPYRRGQLLTNFVIEPLRQVVAHREAAPVPLSTFASLGELTLLWPRVRMGENVGTGKLTEIRSNSHLDNGVTLGDRNVIGQGTIIRSGANLGGAVYVGSDSRIDEEAKINTGSTFDKDCYVGPAVSIGYQALIQRGVQIGAGVWADDSVRVGSYARIHEAAIIGEAARISGYSVIGRQAIIGADAVVGQAGVIAPTAWIKSGEYVPGRYEQPLGRRSV